MRENDSRKLSMPALNELRGQAEQCRPQGMGLKGTAGLCGMSRNTVNEAWQRYKAGGWKAIRVWKTGRPIGKGRILTSEQEKETQRLLRERTPDQLKMPYALWNRPAVREPIERRYDRKLAIRRVGLYLERWGFTPQKPPGKAYEQRPEAVRKWMHEDFPAIRARAKAEGCRHQARSSTQEGSA
ncbi:MAG: winged helix-turn-helix domain-containing protein [Flavobacteriales bacterium]|nr:winged helix-turn-helix domain-containing protein [Flavobacteriales bacterium]